MPDRSLTVAGEAGGKKKKRNVKSCQSSAITERKWQEGEGERGEKKKENDGTRRKFRREQGLSKCLEKGEEDIKTGVDEEIGA